MLLLTCQSQYLVLYSFSGCRAHSRAGPIGVSLDQGDFPLKFCYGTLVCRSPLCFCLDTCSKKIHVSYLDQNKHSTERHSLLCSCTFEVVQVGTSW